MKNFGDIKNIRRFVMSLTSSGVKTRSLLLGIFYTLLIYGFVTPCGALMRPLPLDGEGQRDMQNRFLFSAQHTNSLVMSENQVKNLQGVKHSSPLAKTDQQSLKKLIKTLDKRVSELQKENDYMRFFIVRNYPHNFSMFRDEHPIDSQDWNMLCEMENKLRNI